VRIRTASHLYGETILRNDFPAEYAELTAALTGCELPLRPSGPFTERGRPQTPKRQRRRVRGVDGYALFPIDQAALNQRFDDVLREAGWSRQPFVVQQPAGSVLDKYLKGDFSKHRVFVEVEFGNAASLYRDLFKFQIAGRSGVGEVGVLVVATADLAKFFDSGVATFEQAVSLLPYMRIGIQLPIWVVGLDVDDWAPIRARYDEMQAEASAHGIRCHPFDFIHSIAPEELFAEYLWEPDPEA